MPQLDKVSFLSQFFWLCVFFFTFYIASLKYFIPEMSRILKYRKKRLNESHQGVTSMHQEKVQLTDSADAVIESALRSGKSSFKDMLQTTENWLSNFVDQTNRTKFLHTNSSYLSSVGKTSLSHSISVQGIFSNVSTTIFLYALLERMNPPFLQKVSALNSRSYYSSTKNVGSKKQVAINKGNGIEKKAFSTKKSETKLEKKDSKKVVKNRNK